MGLLGAVLLSCTSLLGIDGTFTPAAYEMCSMYLETYCIGAHSLPTFDEMGCEQAAAPLKGQTLKDCIAQAKAEVIAVGNDNGGCATFLRCLVTNVGFEPDVQGTFRSLPCLGNGSSSDVTDTGCAPGEVCCVQTTPSIMPAPPLALGFCE